MNSCRETQPTWAGSRPRPRCRRAPPLGIGAGVGERVEHRLLRRVHVPLVDEHVLVGQARLLYGWLTARITAASLRRARGRESNPAHSDQRVCTDHPGCAASVSNAQTTRPSEPVIPVIRVRAAAHRRWRPPRGPRRSTIPKVSGPTVLIMAAGEGTRMRSSVPKVLHPICGRPMIAWPVLAAREAGAGRVCVIVSPDRDLSAAPPGGHRDRRPAGARRNRRRGAGGARPRRATRRPWWS